MFSKNDLSHWILPNCQMAKHLPHQTATNFQDGPCVTFCARVMFKLIVSDHREITDTACPTLEKFQYNIRDRSKRFPTTKNRKHLSLCSGHGKDPPSGIFEKISSCYKKDANNNRNICKIKREHKQSIGEKTQNLPVGSLYPALLMCVSVIM